MSQGPEDYLVLELEDVAKGHKPRSDYWRKDWGGPEYFSGAKSSNWHPVEIAIRYAMATGAEVERVRTYLRTIFFPFQRRRFMASELMTVIYGSMHLGAALVIARTASVFGHAEIRSEALAWIEAYLAILSARQLASGYVVVAGMRSAGHEAWVYGDVWGQYALALGEESRSDADAWHALKKAGKGPERAWQTAVFKACREFLQIALSSLRSRFGAIPEGFSAMCELRVSQWDDGSIATWCGENVNGNTRPELVGVYSARTRAIVNYPGEMFSPLVVGEKIIRRNRGPWQARCEMTNSRLVISAETGEIVVPLPAPGSPRWTLTLPRESGASVPIPEPAALPADSEGVAAFVAATRAIGAQDAETEAIIALIRSGRWADAAGAVEVVAVPKRNFRARWSLAESLREEAR